MTNIMARSEVIHATLEQNRAQRLLDRAKGQGYFAERGRWFSWKIRKIDHVGDTVVVYSGLPIDKAFDLVRELNGALKDGIEIGYEQGAEWGTRE